MTEIGDGRGSRERVQWRLQTSFIQRFLRTRRRLAEEIERVRQRQRIKFLKTLNFTTL